MKSIYIHAVQRAHSVANRAGLLPVLERRLNQRWARWLRSLFAFYNVEDLIRIDTPWWTLHSAEILSDILRQNPNARVFEYGTGASTIWLGSRARTVLSVEHDPTWKTTMDRFISALPNVTIHLIPPETLKPNSTYRSSKRGWRSLDFENYVRWIDQYQGYFDLVVIDGRCRAKCLEHALPKLDENGIILFDNSGRRRYRRAIRKTGLLTIETFGLTACLPYPDRTTIIFNKRPVIARSGEIRSQAEFFIP